MILIAVKQAKFITSFNSEKRNGLFCSALFKPVSVVRRLFFLYPSNMIGFKICFSYLFVDKIPSKNIKSILSSGLMSNVTIKYDLTLYL